MLSQQFKTGHKRIFKLYKATYLNQGPNRVNLAKLGAERQEILKIQATLC